MIHHEDDRVTLHHGDCLDVLRSLPDASVDSVCTDPPYGLEFMGKDWDAPWKAEGAHWRAPSRLPGSHSTNPTPRPQNFGTAGLPFQQWCEAWAAECLRVLKPGGHLLAFGGTRTWHRLACAVEDAGFEVRDSIAWLYGSGFPKSLDVSKAIDKVDATHERRDRALRFTAWMRSTGITSRQVDAATGTNMGGHYLTAESQPAVATVAHLDMLRPLLPEVPEWVEEMAQERTVESLNYAARPITQAEVRPIASGEHITFDQRSSTERERRDIPATDAARAWAGWGTALKPGHEPAVVARKPLQPRDILAGIGSHLDTLEQVWLALEVDPRTPTGEAGATSEATGTPSSSQTGATSSSTVTSWRACWAELCDLTSTSTTATTSETTTALRTLSSSLSRLMDESTHPNATSPHGSTSLASAVDNLFASVVCGLRATLALSATEPATDSTPASPLDAAEGKAFEPVVVARKPLAAGTVAANVLAHGTGALNIDASRIESGAEYHDLSVTQGGKAGGGFDVGSSDGTRHTTFTPGSGRWPANVILDEDMAAALDEQSGDLSSQRTRTNPAAPSADTSSHLGTMHRAGRSAEYLGEKGGASRFFYVAKAPKKERPVVDGVAHPTVKPLALMRWLVRLVTPPGGVVLEPFAGSGTTVEACLLEGFRCVAIEKGDEYLPLILARIDRQRLPEVAELTRTTDPEVAIVEQLAPSLFDFEEGLA